MSSRSLALWLVDNAGPVIRYRTLVEILGEQDVWYVNNALESLYESKLVQKWLDNLLPRLGFHQFHSSSEFAFENAMGRLVQLGLSAGLQKFDKKTLPFRVWLSERIQDQTQEGVGPWDGFSELLLASFLAYAGYDETDPVRIVVQERLEVAHWFVNNIDYDSFYVSGSRKEGLVDPLYYDGGSQRLPYVHDIRGFASSRWIFKDAKHRNIAERVVEEILGPAYQGLRSNYGYMKYGKSYYSIGRIAKVPNYSEPPANDREMARLLLDLEMLAPFKTARECDWFQRSMDLLETQVTEDGHYRFPRSWLPESSSGYWVGGLYNALEDNRRKQAAIDYESTFRVLKIKQLAGLL